MNNILYILLFLLLTFDIGFAKSYYIELTSNAPVIQGAEITFSAKCRFSGSDEKPVGIFQFEWKDNALKSHYRQTNKTTIPEDSWNVTYPADDNPVGIYIMQVRVFECYNWFPSICYEKTSTRLEFTITNQLNGELNLVDHGVTKQSTYIPSKTIMRHEVALNAPDMEYIKKNATTIQTYWFIDCQYYGVTPNFTFDYKYDKPNQTHAIEAIVVAGFEPITTPAPITTSTTSTTTTKPTTTKTTTTTTKIPTVESVTLSNSVEKHRKKREAVVTISNNTNVILPGMPFPYVCSNKSEIVVDSKKVSGYFNKTIVIKDAIRNISVSGNNWIPHGDILFLQAKWDGSPPFLGCIQYKNGPYNITGKENCTDKDVVISSNICDFPLSRYYSDPGEYTIVIIINNQVTKKVSPVTVNVYKVERKKQLSVIVVPVSFSLVAVVLIVFGIAYYIQNRRRFTVEVANFDFGQQYADMEYKTFRERLRDSISNAFMRTPIPDGSEPTIWPPSRKYGSMT